MGRGSPDPAFDRNRRAAVGAWARPWNILQSMERLIRRIFNLGWDAVEWLWRYFLLGAVLVIPIWLIIRLIGTARAR
jgi:hypothetical protein